MWPFLYFDTASSDDSISAVMKRTVLSLGLLQLLLTVEGGSRA